MFLDRLLAPPACAASLPAPPPCLRHLPALPCVTCRPEAIKSVKPQFILVRDNDPKGYDTKKGKAAELANRIDVLSLSKYSPDICAPDYVFHHEARPPAWMTMTRTLSAYAACLLALLRLRRLPAPLACAACLHRLPAPPACAAFLR